MVIRGGMSPRLVKAEVQAYGLLSRATFQEILVVGIHILKVQDKGRL